MAKQTIKVSMSLPRGGGRMSSRGGKGGKGGKGGTRKG